jgi:hypothetical protein
MMDEWVEGKCEQEKESIPASNDMCEEAPESMYYSPSGQGQVNVMDSWCRRRLQGTVDPKNHSSSDARTLQAASVVWEDHNTGTVLHASWCEKLGVENQQRQVGCSERMWNRRRPWRCTSLRYLQASRKPMRPHLNHSHPFWERMGATQGCWEWRRSNYYWNYSRGDPDERLLDCHWSEGVECYCLVLPPLVGGLVHFPVQPVGVC